MDWEKGTVSFDTDKHFKAKILPVSKRTQVHYTPYELLKSMFIFHFPVLFLIQAYVNNDIYVLTVPCAVCLCVIRISTEGTLCCDVHIMIT